MGLHIMRHRMEMVNSHVCALCLLLTMSPECYNTIQETIICILG